MTGSVAVRRNQVALYLPPLAVKRHQFRRRGETLHHGGQPEEQREVERGIHTNRIFGLAGVLANELRDFPLVVEYLSVGEEILLANAESEFPHGVAEGAREVALDELQRIDAESVNVKLGDQKLVGADQRFAYGLGRTELGVVAKRGHQFLERLEVAAIFPAFALPAEKLVALQLDRPDTRVE